MADVITRLKVESSEYDQKLSRATQQLQHMEKEVRRTGATFAYADKEEIAFIQSIGQMDTQTTSAKGKLREMTDALLSISQTYKQLTDEEKSSPFGQAMAASIDQLKARAAEVKDAMADMNRELSGMASDTQAFDQITGSVNLMVSVFQVGQGALQAFGVENEDAADAIAKLQGVMAVTSGLQKIQNALQKESNVMLGVSKVQTLAAAAAESIANKAKQSNIVATKAATVAQKALNLVANANPYVLLATAVVAVTTALWAMSKASKAAAEAEEQREKAADEAAQRADAVRQSFTDTSAEAMNSASRLSYLQDAYRNANSEMEKTGILKQAQTEFKKLGIECNSLTDAQTVLSRKGTEIIELIRMQGSIAALSAIRMEKYKESFKNMLTSGYDVKTASILAGSNKEVQELDKQITELQIKAQGASDKLGIGKKKGGGSKSKTKVEVEPELPEGSAAALQKKLSELNKQWSMATSDEDRSGIQKQIDETQKALDAMKGKIEKLPPIEPELIFSEKGISDLGKQIKDKMSGLEIGSDDYLIAAENLLDFTTFENLMKAATERGVNIDPEWMSSLFEDIKVGAEVDDDSWQALVDNINEKLAEMDLPPITLDVKTGGVEEAQQQVDNLADNVNKAIGVFGQLGGVMEQIDDPGAKVAGIVMGAVAEVAGTFAASLKGTFTPWDWIAAAISGVSTMIATISAIKSATSGGFASGGIIPGNSFSGDNLRTSDYGINAGELVLNKAQQSNLAGQLNSNPMGNLKLATEISGRNLRVVLNNDNRSEGGSRGYYSDIH